MTILITGANGTISGALLALLDSRAHATAAGPQNQKG
jgi:uncharacterized protein YbjT (DUF2867 family)